MLDSKMKSDASLTFCKLKGHSGDVVSSISVKNGIFAVHSAVFVALATLQRLAKATGFAGHDVNETRTTGIQQSTQLCVLQKCGFLDGATFSCCFSELNKNFVPCSVANDE